MITAPVVEQGALAGLDVYGIRVALNGVLLVRSYDYSLLLYIKSQHFEHYPFARGELFLQLSVGREEVQMVITVALTLHDERLTVPWQKCNRVLGFHIFVVCLAVKFRNLASCFCVVAHQSAIVLVAI